MKQKTRFMQMMRVFYWLGLKKDPISPYQFKR